MNEAMLLREILMALNSGDRFTYMNMGTIDYVFPCVMSEMGHITCGNSKDRFERFCVTNGLRYSYNETEDKYTIWR